MAVFEEELMAALSARADWLTTAATLCIGSIDDPLTDHRDAYPPSWELDQLSNAKSFISNAEALTAAIMVRCGVPWDAMAAGLSVSRQALHRRLARRGEDLFGEVQKHSGSASLLFQDQLVRLGAMTEKDRLADLAVFASEKAASLNLLRQTPNWWKTRTGI
jgi:hypothetical protein